jgi:Na+/proline symporter
MTSLLSITLGLLAIIWLGKLFWPTLQSTNNAFLVADRNMSWWATGLSVAVGYTWMSAYLQSGGFAYQFGVWGLALFLLPYFLGIWYFNFIAQRIKTTYGQGCTFSEIVKDTVGQHTQKIYHLQSFLFALTAIVINFIGLRLFLTSQWDISVDQANTINLIVGLATVGYCWQGGLKSSIRTDVVQEIAIWVLMAVLIIFLIGFSPATISTAINTEFKLEYLLFPGLFFMLLIWSGLTADQELFQRTWATKTLRETQLTFQSSAVFFLITPIFFGVLGLLAAANGTTVKAADQSSILFVKQLLPTGFMLVLYAIFMLKVTATLNNQFNAVASVIANDYFKNNEKQVRLVYKSSMIATMFCGWMLSLFNISLMIPLMIFGVYRMATFPLTFSIAVGKKFKDWPTVIAILIAILGASVTNYWVIQNKLPSHYSAWGLIVSLIISIIGLILNRRRV